MEATRAKLPDSVAISPSTPRVSFVSGGGGGGELRAKAKPKGQTPPPLGVKAGSIERVGGGAVNIVFPGLPTICLSIQHVAITSSTFDVWRSSGGGYTDRPFTCCLL